MGRYNCWNGKHLQMIWFSEIFCLGKIRKCHLIEHPKSLNRSPTHFCFKTSGILSTKNDSGPTETGWLRKINKARINPSPLRLLRGAILEAKGTEEIEDADILENAARVVRETRFCYKFRDGKCDKGRDFPFKHVKEPKPRSTTPKNKKRRGKEARSPSENRKSKEEMAKIPCTYFQQGNCRRGDKCFYKHEKVAAPMKKPKRTNSPAPKKRPVQKLRPALLKGMLVLQRERDCQRLQRPWKNKVIEQLCSHQKWNTSRFLQLVNNGKLCINHVRVRKAIQGQTWYLKLIPWSSTVLRSLPASSRRSWISVASICNPHAVVSVQTMKVVWPACIGPNSKASNTHLPAVATPAPKDKCVWLVDTGSDQDLISEGMLKTAQATKRRVSDTPICLATANGSTRADEVADVTVDALHRDFTPYILDETPAVLSVGVRCMEPGYSFVWPADSKPYFIRAECGWQSSRNRSFLQGHQRKALQKGLQVCKAFRDGQPFIRCWWGWRCRRRGANWWWGRVCQVQKDIRLRGWAKSSHHQFCHYPKNAFRKVCQKARMMAPPAKKKGGQKRLQTKCFGGPYRCWPHCGKGQRWGRGQKWNGSSCHEGYPYSAQARESQQIQIRGLLCFCFQSLLVTQRRSWCSLHGQL